MRKINLFKEISFIDRGYQLMLVTLFFMKLGQFMLLPFLAIYLIRHVDASPSSIGITIGAGPFVYGFVGIWAGILVDRLGVRKIISTSLFVGGVAFILFFSVNSIVWYFIVSILTGLTRSFFDIASKSYGISQFSTEQQKICFSMRFMTVNSAAAIGPVIGAYFASHDHFDLFMPIGFFYIFLAVSSLFFMNDGIGETNLQAEKNTITLKGAFSILLHDNSRVQSSLTKQTTICPA